MRKVPVWMIVVWIVMALCAVAIFPLGMLGIPMWVRWLVFLVIIIPDAAWIALRAVAGAKKKARKPAAFVDNMAVYQRISRETQEAVGRYLGAVTRKGLLKGSALYERPWFLLLGPRKSGKTSLVRGSGLYCPMRYPSEKDGLQVEGADQVTWYFANEAVMIDTPGSLSQETGKDEWQALVASLQKARPDKPVDGIAVVVNAQEVLNADEGKIKELARTLRGRIDEVIAWWGIEFPVYLIFNHIDKVPGFKEYFGDQLTRAQDQIFGATVSQEQQKVLPRLAFAEEFSLLARSLTDLRLDKLYKERGDSAKRLICRFVIHFEGIQEKLGALVSELFKPSSYEGKPLFRGFYFTSCYEPQVEDRPSPVSSAPDMSMTIANHPLNPKRMMAAAMGGGTKTSASVPAGGRKETVKSLFVLPIFREIMVRDKTLVKSTQKRTRRSLAHHLAWTGAMAAVAAVVVCLMFVSRGRSQRLLGTISTDLAGLGAAQESLMDHYNALETMRKNIAVLQKNAMKGAPALDVLFGYYKGAEALEGLKTAYFERLERFILKPAVKYLEYDIRSRSGAYGELAGDDYNMLYRALKAYLSMSEAVADHSTDIDTVFLRPVLQEAVTASLLSATKRSRLPETVETILRNNIGMYLLFLKRGEIARIQENQPLAADARSRLRRLPNAQNLYDAVINKLQPDAPQITLDQVLGRQGEGILKSVKTISTLYTQEGWDQVVSDAISEACKDPLKIDWVIGLTREEVPENMLDTRQLRNDMVNAYIVDFRSQWLSFVASVGMEQFGDLPRSSRILQKLIAEKSELAVLLETVSNYTLIKTESDADKVADKALELAAKTKTAKKYTKMAGKVGVDAPAAPEFSLGRKTPFEELNATFDPLRSFSRSAGGALAGYEGYRDKVSSLVEQITNIESRGEDYSAVVFNAGENDPLLATWKFTQTALTAMPAQLAEALKNLLLTPVIYTGSAASQTLTAVLNRKWQSEVIKPYTSRFSGKYPFSGRGEEASFNDVMDFFRPTTGTYWGFYDRVLAPFVIKTGNGWQVRSPGSLTLNFNPELAKSLTAAERIRDIFFKPNGEVRSLNMTISTISSNKYKARFEVNGQAFEIPAGSGSVQVSWPSEGSVNAAALKIQVSSDFLQEITFNGRWGFLKLMQAAKISPINNSSFTATWQANVQNMYMVIQKYRVQVSSADNPFVDQVFAKFICPTDLMAKAPAGQQEDRPQP